MLLRLEPGEELIESIFRACKENDFRNAIITNCIGSLSKITYVFAIKDETKPLGFRYCDPIQEEGIIEFLGAQGNICRDTEGKLLHHIHAVFGDGTGKIKGGHLIEQSNVVLATMEIMLEEVEDINMMRAMDDLIKAPVLKFM
jgi:uncharacterized protein